MFVHSSDTNPVTPPQFVAHIFLDTNIIVYLLDGSYVSLDNAIEYCRSSMFAELVSSHYVLFELMGVRKKEHYIRALLKKSIQIKDGKADISGINISALLKYKEGFMSDTYKFDDLKDEIKDVVETEMDLVYDRFSIDITNYTMHRGLFGYTTDLFIQTQISKEDAFVLCSAVWPEESSNNQIIFLTNDSQFCQASIPLLNTDFFTKRFVKNPDIYHIENTGLEGGTHVNLTISDTPTEQVQRVLNNIIMKRIISDNYLLGYTIGPSRDKNDIVCFSLEATKEIRGEVYLVIIAADLSFIYSTSTSIIAFQTGQTVLTLPFSSASKTPMCFLLDIVKEGLDKSYESNLAIDLIRTPGNMVFIHPDSMGMYT